MAKSAKKRAPARSQGANSVGKAAPGNPKLLRRTSAASVLSGVATKASDGARTLKSNNSESGTKQSRVLAMLRSPAGATIAAMMGLTGWQQHSVRGFLAGVVRKRLKLKLTSQKLDGSRVYRIADGGHPKASVRQPKARRAA